MIEKVIDEIGYFKKSELEITDVNNYYLKYGRVKAKIIEGYWSDAGTFETLLKSSNFIQKLNNE